MTTPARRDKRISSKDFDLTAVKAQVLEAIERAIRSSAIEFPMRDLTQLEIRRRFTLCYEGYRLMRDEYSYSIQKSIDFFPRLIRSDLNGDAEVKMSNKSTWVADDDGA